ncbi:MULTISPECIES: hypothetical protein [Streptomyces]
MTQQKMEKQPGATAAVIVHDLSCTDCVDVIICQKLGVREESVCVR